MYHTSFPPRKRSYLQTKKLDTSVWTCCYSMSLSSPILAPVARHPAERMSSSTIFVIAAAVLALFGLDSWISNMISKIVLELPNTRKQELEGRLFPQFTFFLITDKKTCSRPHRTTSHEPGLLRSCCSTAVSVSQYLGLRTRS